MGYTRQEAKILAAAMDKHMGKMQCFYPTAINGREHEAMHQAEIEHAPNVAVRMNPRNFRIEYYNAETGEIVSEHI